MLVRMPNQKGLVLNCPIPVIITDKIKNIVVEERFMYTDGLRNISPLHSTIELFTNCLGIDDDIFSLVVEDVARQLYFSNLNNELISLVGQIGLRDEEDEVVIKYEIIKVDGKKFNKEYPTRHMNDDVEIYEVLMQGYSNLTNICNRDYRTGISLTEKRKKR